MYDQGFGISNGLEIDGAGFSGYCNIESKAIRFGVWGRKVECLGCEILNPWIIPAANYKLKKEPC